MSDTAFVVTFTAEAEVTHADGTKDTDELKAVESDETQDDEHN